MRGTEVLVGVRVRARSQPGVRSGEGGLVISVAAPPKGGRATDEAHRAMAAALGVPPSGVRLRSGPSARRKVFAVDGLPVDEVRSRLLRAVSGSG